MTTGIEFYEHGILPGASECILKSVEGNSGGRLSNAREINISRGVNSHAPTGFSQRSVIRSPNAIAGRIYFHKERIGYSNDRIPVSGETNTGVTIRVTGNEHIFVFVNRYRKTVIPAAATTEGAPHA